MVGPNVRKNPRAVSIVHSCPSSRREGRLVRGAAGGSGRSAAADPGGNRSPSDRTARVERAASRDPSRRLCGRTSHGRSRRSSPRRPALRRRRLRDQPPHRRRRAPDLAADAGRRRCDDPAASSLQARHPNPQPPHRPGRDPHDRRHPHHQPVTDALRPRDDARDSPPRQGCERGVRASAHRDRRPSRHPGPQRAAKGSAAFRRLLAVLDPDGHRIRSPLEDACTPSSAPAATRPGSRTSGCGSVARRSSPTSSGALSG